MGILIANIGTSDLAIKINVNGQERYLPIDPLSEPNQDKSGLTPEEINMWEKPYLYFQSSGLYTELGFPSNVVPSSRELTERLLAYYQDNPEYWTERIFPPRIWGVIEKARTMGINQAYIIVSNQKVEQKDPKVRNKDTVHLYPIIEKWFATKLPYFTLIPEYIPEDIPLIDSDLLFKFYFDFFNRLRTAEEKNKRQQKLLKIGDTVLAKVIAFENQGQGVFVETIAGVKGFIHIDNISQAQVDFNDLRNIFTIDSLVYTLVIKIDNGKYKLSTKAFEETPGEIINNPQAVFNRVQQTINLQSASDLEVEEELMLISVKGGTIQMKTALQLQGISVLSAFKRLLFVNPQLCIPSVFAGQPSSCELESYWRYIRTHKYQTIRLLLERWDFDGAIQILTDWQEYLSYLINQGIVDQESTADNQVINKLEQSSDTSELILTALKFARACFNLDFQTAQKFAQLGIEAISKYPHAAIFKKFEDGAAEYQYSQNRLLHLYSLNRIYWQLDEIAIFLAYISSFYEEVLHGLIRKLLGRDNYLNEKWEIDVRKIDQKTWDTFVSLERLGNPRFTDWERSRRQKFQLVSRYSKRNLIEALVKIRNNKDEQQYWHSLCDNLKKLDYWATKRNELIHTAKGLSKELMRELSKNYIPENNQSLPCAADDILTVMAEITKNELIGLKTIYRNNFIGDDVDYYIYTSVRNWVVQTLISDGVQ